MSWPGAGPRADGQLPRHRVHDLARLARCGSPPSAADGQIAAIAAVNELLLVSSDLCDFRRFQGLRVEDWRHA